MKFNECALPEHLKGKLHNDWPFWPLTKIPRSFMIKGPRCPKDSPGYAYWPPKLVSGFDVTRWEWCDKNTATTGVRREIYIPDFLKKKITNTIYLFRWDVIENGQKINVDLRDGWWPSIIPTTSEYGWLKLSPEFHCAWRTTPGWSKYYWRWGNRPDFDMYYNPFPYAGRNPE